jgi:hypothetical protein
MDISNIIQLINSVGFPIFVSVYLLLSTNKLVTENTKMLGELRDEIQRMNNLK